MYGCNLAVSKSDEHLKTLPWFTSIKVYSLTLFKLVVGERGTEYENWTNCIC